MRPADTVNCSDRAGPSTSDRAGRFPAGGVDTVPRRRGRAPLEALGRRMVVAVAVAAVLALAACSSGESDPVASAGGAREANSGADQASESPAPLDPDAQALAFAGCMRENGVDMPDPAPGQQGLGDAFQAVVDDYDRVTMEQALSACEDELPQYEQEAHGDDVMLELAECLRQQGLDVSDDPFSDMHSGGFDQRELTAAMEVCRDVLIAGGQ